MGFLDKRKKKRTDNYSEGSRYQNDRPIRNDYSENRTMTRVVCDTCGKNCEVPFRPVSGKDVHCNDCFRKHKPKPQERREYTSDSSARNNSYGSSNNDLAKINRKLDKILEIIGG